MLSKKYRLSRSQIKVLVKRGKGYKLGIIGVKVFPNQQSYSRFACVISKSVAKKAVQRNRLKRVIFDELKKEKAGGPARITKQSVAGGKDYLIKLYRFPENEEILRKKIKSLLTNY